MSRRGIVLFALMALIWGIPYLLIRVAVEEVEPSVVVFGRTAIGALILLPIVIGRGDLRTVMRHSRWVAAFAIIEMAIPWVLVASAEQELPSSTAALLIAGVPLVGALIAWAQPHGEPMGRTSLMGMLIGLAGVLAIVGVDAGPTNPVALLEMAIVVVCYAVGPVILARRLGGVSGMGVSAVALAMTAALYLGPAAAQWPAAPISTDALVSLVLLGIVCTALAFVVFAALIGDLPRARDRHHVRQPGRRHRAGRGHPGRGAHGRPRGRLRARAPGLRAGHAQAASGPRAGTRRGRLGSCLTPTPR